MLFILTGSNVALFYRYMEAEIELSPPNKNYLFYELYKTGVYELFNHFLSLA